MSRHLRCKSTPVQVLMQQDELSRHMAANVTAVISMTLPVYTSA